MEQAIEHQLGVGVDAPLGQAALGIDAVEALFEGRGAVLEAADPAVGALLGFAYPSLDVAAEVLLHRVELAADIGVEGGVLFVEHLLDAAADPLDLLVELGARALGGGRDRLLARWARGFVRCRGHRGGS